MSRDQAQIVYLSHGGGPLPLLGDPGHGAILVISAHWEEQVATLLGSQ